jgi:hypothetical protein
MVGTVTPDSGKILVRAVFWSMFILFISLENVSAHANNAPEETISECSYCSISWHTAMNEPEKPSPGYPEKKKITPETIRLTLNEYYIPQISDLLDKGMDYFEWLNTLDDPYLNRYKVDLRVDPADERLKLFWKRQF